VHDDAIRLKIRQYVDHYSFETLVEKEIEKWELRIADFVGQAGD